MNKNGERKLVPLLQFPYVVYEFRNTSPNTCRVWELCEFLGRKKVVTGAEKEELSRSFDDSPEESKMETEEPCKASSIALYFLKCHSPTPGVRPKDIPIDKAMGDSPELRVLYTIKLTHTKLTGLRKITVNNEVLHRSHKFFDTGSEHVFNVGPLPARLVIKHELGGFRYELTMDGAQLLDVPSTPSLRSESLVGAHDGNYLQLWDSQ